MTLVETQIQDLQFIETDLGNPSFVWKGNTYGCIPSIAVKGEKLELGGFLENLDLVLTVRTNQFSNNGYPAPQDAITFNNTLYRIRKVGTKPLNVALKLYCYAPYEGIR